MSFSSLTCLGIRSVSSSLAMFWVATWPLARFWVGEAPGLSEFRDCGLDDDRNGDFGSELLRVAATFAPPLF